MHFIKLLRTLQYISQNRILNYVYNYIKTHKQKWKNKSKIIYKTNDSIILIFGKPTFSLFIPIDSSINKFIITKNYIETPTHFNSKISIVCAFYLAQTTKKLSLIFSC